MGQENPPPYQTSPQAGNQFPTPYTPANPQVVDQQPLPYHIENPQLGYQQPISYYPGEPLTVQPHASGSMASASALVDHVPVVGLKSISMTCPTCNSTIQTEVETKASKHAHRMAIVLCLLGCWLCCCLAPYGMNTCMDADHKCPSCKRIIGTHKC